MIYEKTERAIPSPTFCVLPWVHLYADELGAIFPCCIAMQSGTPIADAEGRAYTIHDLDDATRAWNSESMRSIRRDMVSGVRNPICEGCWRVEDLKMLSYRRTSNRDYHALLPEIVAGLEEDGSAPPIYRSVDLRLGNLCNLRCRMCSPQSSKALSGEWLKLFEGRPGLAATLDRLKKVDWYRKPEFWAALEHMAPNIEVLNFAGGEPLLIKEQFAFLARLVELGHAPNIQLEYITNGTQLPKEALALWPHFKSVGLLISLDGFGKVDEFIRHPTRWSQLDGHLRRIDAEFDELGVTEVRFNTTVQAYNVLVLDELFDYTLGFQRIQQLPGINLLTRPECFQPSVLPLHLRRLAEERLTAFRHRTEATWPGSPRQRQRFAANLDGIVEVLRTQDHTAHLGEFRRRNAAHDRFRRQDLAEAIPVLAELLEEPEVEQARDARG